MSLEALKRSRSCHQGVVTREWNRYKNQETADPSTFDVSMIKEKLERVGVRPDDFYEVHDEICTLTTDPTKLDAEQKVADQFEDNWEATCTLLR